MGSYYIESYGCAANEFDTKLIEVQLERKGFQRTEDPSKADILFINTCIVKKTTEDRMRSRIEALSRVNKPLIVTGCMAEALPNLIKKIAPKANIISPHHYDEINRLTDQILLGKKIIKVGKKTIDKPALIANSGGYSIKSYEFPVVVSQGCLGSCSFCITKFARGAHKSYPIDSIISAVRRAIKAGAVEIRLTGQDLGPYGTDLGTSLIDLLERICEIEGDFMVRLGMASPDTIDPILDNVVDVIKNCEKLYKFIHLPVQSGSDRILRLMRRNYTSDLFINQVNRIRRKMGYDISIATDIIVAFPTETEEDHEKTLELLKKTKPDIVNISRYGDRPMTVASKLYPKIHSGVAKRRSSEVFRLVRSISLEHNMRYLGKKVDVFYIEKKENRIVGRTKNYRMVYSDVENMEKIEPKVWMRTLISDVTWKALYGEILAYTTKEKDPPPSLKKLKNLNFI